MDNPYINACHVKSHELGDVDQQGNHHYGQLKSFSFVGGFQRPCLPSGAKANVAQEVDNPYVPAKRCSDNVPNDNNKVMK